MKILLEKIYLLWKNAGKKIWNYTRKGETLAINFNTVKLQIIHISCSQTLVPEKCKHVALSRSEILGKVVHLSVWLKYASIPICL